MQGPGPGQAVGNPATTRAFAAETLSGRSIRFPEDFKGKLVLLNFWATWCLPCRAEIPHLRETFEKYRDQGLEIVGVSMDQSGPAIVRRFVSDQNMTWENILQGAPAIAQQFGVSAIPAPFLINGDTGAVLASGDALLGKALTATIEKHLESRPR